MQEYVENNTQKEEEIQKDYNSSLSDFSDT
jgi:hypothetical protein